MARPRKVYRLNYWQADPELAAALTIEGKPSAIKIASAADRFVGVSDNGITLSPGAGSSINLQSMSHNFMYGGLLTDLPFPLSVMPTTPFTPFPKQMFSPPLAQLLPVIRDMSMIASSFVGL